eukprot:6994343-Karenia_brevis.AAC.1
MRLVVKEDEKQGSDESLTIMPNSIQLHERKFMSSPTCNKYYNNKRHLPSECGMLSPTEAFERSRIYKDHAASHLQRKRNER